MGKKRLFLANFNITFGQKNEPLLEHFEDVFIPALAGGVVRRKGDDTYIFENIRLFELDGDEFVLACYFVKDTIVEIKSRHTQKGLVYTNESYPSAPFSILVVFLKNHRALLVKNQKESPDVRSLNATINYVLKKYIFNTNKGKKEEEKLPYALVNIVNLPSEGAITEYLDRVKKIKELILRLYPLNPEIPVNNILEGIETEIEELGASGGKIIVNSPTDKTKVVKLLTDTKGLVEPSLKVEYKNGGVGTLKSEDFTLSLEVDVSDGAVFTEQVTEIIEYGRKIPEMTQRVAESSGEYNKFVNVLKRLKEQLNRGTA